ncbi:tRNA pseudouridine(38-40) synthase TruA [Litorivicinus lipolyticus]|uniref:tRNA pseudouridine synthase A n=1 Tax=Litorivicinus lipolyticus TaxID=418701 RepID=A0A5Q2QCL7_9GAMM|nr:tRNA pseudouridine(38-40) synthase TruA [Litorivicinus lipolyticus]QGG79737.1 tRNA pseudouridine(38-40) synthase TruA [Litorivicinus lipolyticus]
MTRWAACIEYQGSNYYGWQTQEIEGKSVQPWVERALSKIADRPIEVVCAGRTDTGVHATVQVVHFDTDVERPARAWALGGNTHLPDDISFIWAVPVADDFSARFSARWRRYHYVFQNSTTRPAIASQHLTHVHNRLDLSAMARAARVLEGVHDFTSLRSSACQAPNPVRDMHFVRLYQLGSLIVIDVQANAFLHHMVRNIAGSLLAVGKGDRTVEWLGDVLQAKDRALAGVTAAANGLHLVGVGYEPSVVLPETLRFPPLSVGIVRPENRVWPAF